MTDERCGTCRHRSQTPDPIAIGYGTTAYECPLYEHGTGNLVWPDDRCHLTPSAWEAKEDEG